MFYRILDNNTHVPYNDNLYFATGRKAKQYMRANRLNKNKWEIIFK